MKFPIPILLVALATPLVASAGDTLLPAGSIIQCTVSEPKISSKTDQIGDPILCQVSHAEVFGRATIPYGSYLVGRFEDFKDPGHFVGKGWIELRFDRLVVGDTILPMDARVVSAPNYPVDAEGKIHGTGHAVRDTVEWFIPVLWPIDIINLPRRGPRVVLKPESRLTLKVMDDVGFPAQAIAAAPAPASSQPALIERNPQPQYPSQYSDQSYQPQQQYAPAPVVQAYANPAPAAPQTVIYNNYAAPQQQPAPQQQQMVVVNQAPAQPQYIQRAPRPVYNYYPPPPPPPYYGYYARPY